MAKALIVFALLMHAALSISPTFRKAGSKVRVTALNAAGVARVINEIDDESLTKLFGRLAEKVILLDVPGAGTPEMKNCCHGGCDNCQYTRVFDEMRSGRPKWIAHYTHMEHIDGRSHSPAWVSGLFSDGAVSKEIFVSRMRSMPYSPTLGPSISVEETPPSIEAAEDFFVSLAGESQHLTPVEMAAALVRITGQQHGSVWRDFKAGFGSA